MIDAGRARADTSRPVRAALATIGAMTALLAAPAEAAYTPPLTRVRIDRFRLTHTPSIVYARDVKQGVLLETQLAVLGGQYVGQLETEAGFGVQVGVSLAWAQVDADLLARPSPSPIFQGSGVFLGGQLRLYQMLWSGWFSDGGGRPHAVTAFVNLRATRYSSSDTRDLGDRTAEQSQVSAGVGLMAELALGDHVSLCPYAWFSPGLFAMTRYADRGTPIAEEEKGPNLRQPLRVGADVWLYWGGAETEAHLSLSVIASLIDTEGLGNQEVSGVVGYTF